MDNLPKNYDAAGSMFRKAFDTALKSKFPTVKGRLVGSIRKLSDEHKLTPDFANWADRIRLGGNDAAHEEDPFSQEAAKELASFTELVLLYLFTLPGMMPKAQTSTSKSR